MPGYIDGGYIYESPVADITERVLSDSQAQAEIRAFKSQLAPLVSLEATDRWKPYFETEQLGTAHRLALEGLRDAVAYLKTRDNSDVPLAFLRKRSARSPVALIGDLSQTRSLESWQRKNERGVTTQSVVLFIAKNSHHCVFGDQAGIRDIDSSSIPSEIPVSVDGFDYLPHIDGTTDYTVRHSGIDTVAIGGAVGPMLRQYSMQRTWEGYLNSTH